jgi:hypothetical protein
MPTKRLVRFVHSRGDPRGRPKEESMDQTIIETGKSQSNEEQETKSHIRHLVFIHLTRLAWLALTIVAVLLLTFLIRTLTASDGFFVEQQINVIAVIVGLVLVAIVYTIGIVRALRKIRTWEREGKTTLATRGIWALGISAIIIALPMLLIFFIH